jgi:hypothetical protein
MTFTRNQSIMTPDGFSARVLLCGGANVVVWLTNAHWLPTGERYRSYPKSAWQ